MNGPDFLDANVLVYAYDPTDADKQRVARQLLKRALDGMIVLSSQVLAEFASTVLHKKKPPANPNDVKIILEALNPIRVVVPDASMVRRAVEAHAAYGIHFYDGMIIAAAERARCPRIWSEDMNSGQQYFGVKVENPFR